MRLLVYGINYFPELTGIGKFTGEMSEWFVKKGCKVTVITSNPYYPEWKVHKEYKNWFSINKLNGVEVLRCPIYVPKKISGFSRIIHEISFIISSSFYWIGLLFRKPFDVVICIAPPFHTSFFGKLYTKFRGGLLICHIQDLQVDAAKDLQILNNQILLRILVNLERFLLKKVDVISTISEGMITKIKNKNINKDVWLFPNWVDTEYIKPLTKEDSLKEEFGISEESTIVLYSGNLGEKQGLNIIIEAARLLSSNENLKILICGDGPYKKKLEQAIKTYKLDNVILRNLQPYEKLSQLLNTADIHLILQKKAASDLVLPSKLSGIVSAGGFSIVTAEPETTLFELVEKFKFGITIEPENVTELVNAIEEAKTMDLSKFRINARNYAEKSLSKDVILKSFSEQLERLNE